MTTWLEVSATKQEMVVSLTILHNHDHDLEQCHHGRPCEVLLPMPRHSCVTLVSMKYLEISPDMALFYRLAAWRECAAYIMSSCCKYHPDCVIVSCQRNRNSCFDLHHSLTCITTFITEQTRYHWLNLKSKQNHKIYLKEWSLAVASNLVVRYLESILRHHWSRSCSHSSNVCHVTQLEWFVTRHDWRVDSVGSLLVEDTATEPVIRGACGGCGQSSEIIQMWFTILWNNLMFSRLVRLWKPSGYMLQFSTHNKFAGIEPFPWNLHHTM